MLQTIQQTIAYVIMFFVAFGMLGATELRAGFLFGSSVTYPHRPLITIDTNTGVGSTVGPLGISNVSGLAFDRNSNTLYGVATFLDQLLSINTITGDATVIGHLGGGHNAHELAFDSNTNTLYGVGSTNSQLLKINTSTGAATVIGSFGIGFVGGLAFDANSNTLYGSDPVGTDQLLTIDTNTGAATTVGSFGYGFVGGLAFDSNSNTLYGVDRSNPFGQLVTINTSTGAATAVGGSVGVSNVFGLAFAPDSDPSPVPEPCSLALLGIGGLTLLGFRRRRKNGLEISTAT